MDIKNQVFTLLFCTLLLCTLVGLVGSFYYLEYVPATATCGDTVYEGTYRIKTNLMRTEDGTEVVLGTCTIERHGVYGEIVIFVILLLLCVVVWIYLFLKV